MTEVDLYKKLKAALPSVDWCRIENGAGVGMFDVNACCERREFWVELKIDTKPKLRAAQIAWGMRRSNYGGRVFVVMHHPRHPMIAIYKPPFKELVPCPKKYGRLMDKPIAVFHPPFDWEAMLRIFLFS